MADAIACHGRVFLCAFVDHHPEQVPFHTAGRTCLVPEYCAFAHWRRGQRGPVHRATGAGAGCGFTLLAGFLERTRPVGMGICRNIGGADGRQWSGAARRISVSTFCVSVNCNENNGSSGRGERW